MHIGTKKKVEKEKTSLFFVEEKKIVHINFSLKRRKIKM